jgi:hypothetical protein
MALPCLSSIMPGKGAGNARAGQAQGGSSEFHAWTDSNLYLRRHGDDLTLTVEHRAAPSQVPIAIALSQRGPALAGQKDLTENPPALSAGWLRYKSPAAAAG